MTEIKKEQDARWNAMTGTWKKEIFIWQFLPLLKDRMENIWSQSGLWRNRGHRAGVSGGAVQAGEDSKEAVIREVREETGLDVSDCEGGLSFTYQRENLEEGDNYFVDVYHFIKDFSEEDVVLQKEETADFQIATLEEIQEIAKEGKFLHYDSIKQVFEK